MAKPLVIVESPAKAKTIGKFLGDGYVVESSVGHIRDLPSDAGEIPEKYKGEPWARLGVDVNNDFKPLYVVNRDKKSHVAALKKLVKNASELYLATDEDREGEAIAWHLLEVLDPKVPVKRMVFHEITAGAIQHALDNPRDLDRRLVDAQEARRILDRLFGYEVSPVLWKKVKGGLSAGRVQSVATRIIVERERERMLFRAASYYGVTANLAVKRDVTGDPTFEASLVSIDGQRLATGSAFNNDGTRKRDDVYVLDEANANELVAALAGAPVEVTKVEAKPYKRSPAAPFTTSTLQQEAGRKLRFSAARTMQAAQRLYENGYITYMRTDSVTLSDTAVSAARAQITEKYGSEFVASKPRIYKSKAKNAQEAHEAVRPAGETFRTPEEIDRLVGRDEAKLYDLIWKRTIASQMEDARGQSVSVRAVATTTGTKRKAEFAASGLTITFPGFLRAYVEGSDDPDADLGDKDRYLPEMAEGESLDGRSYTADPHETKPPARYTEASLVKKMEELGVGRPSTYASIISTIQNRGYVWKKASALVPHFTAFAVTNLLEGHFPDLVDYAFTARMEDDLDEIAGGRSEPIPWLRTFYFGDGEPGLHDKVNTRLDEIDARAINTIPLGVTADGEPVVAKPGRYGPYVQRGEDTASVPDELAPDELTLEKAIELLDAPNDDRVLGTDEETGLPIVARNGRYGAYVAIGEEGEKPVRTASLFKTHALSRITLETALELLTLPRTVGMWTPPKTVPKLTKAQKDAGEEPPALEDLPDPEPVEVVVANGRYGPYVKAGKETRSLEDEEQLLTISLEECVALLNVPKARGRGAAKPPLKEIGDDPDTGKPIVIKDGRFGPYVTDGETNASLRKADTIERVDLDRALELLAERRAKVGTKKTAKKKKSAKKKKATAKKTASKKKPAKKATAKKATATAVDRSTKKADDEG